ncbi:MAG: FAD-binding oxidoreductase [candidate division Zixibacteria bacterium]|nr:FAD-binding oxidoreductase [candidate division Zixibacteria bacterium]MBU1470615.1 FAD-binding oxidoreductase [candidate division Zixibacteria bacterium]MBU2624316.1 FAD-binding oxidoreductase [candidate division Zixibacteria bacterium]
MAGLKSCIYRLKKDLGPDSVLTEWSALQAYSSDASPYAVKPAAVVLIRSVESAVAARRICASAGVSIHPRGGGSGLAGGALGTGVIMDLSHLDRIQKIDISRKTIEVQSGVVLDRINDSLAPMGLMFAPDPSSSDTCQVGGILANNSSGPRSVKYGTTADYVDMIDVLLPDGRRFELSDLRIDSSEFRQLLDAYRPFEVIYRIIKAKADLIRKIFPRLKKNSSGYNLLSVVDQFDKGIFSLPRLFVGSEGTLGMFLGARLRLAKLPSKKVTLQILFNSLNEVGEAVMELLPTGPAALELVDGSSLDLIGRDKFEIPAAADAMLIVEYDEGPFDEKIEDARKIAGKFNLTAAVAVETDPARQGELWEARKAIVPTLYRNKGRAKPFGFIEDVEVPIEKVPQLVRFVNRAFADEGLTSGIYGHIGDGNVHLRPVVDLSTSEGLKCARRLYSKVYEHVISLGGSTTAEHGDGRLRAAMVERLYGPELYEIFRKIHQELNPDKSINPDVKLSRVDFTENLDFEKVTRLCASCGKCNNYCPAFDVYRTEEMSARGWVRIMLSSEYSRSRAERVLDGCLNCKNCLMVCPAGVDVSEYVMDRRSEKHGTIARTIFDLQADPEIFDKWVKRGGRAMRLINNAPARFLFGLATSPFVHLDRNRIMPQIASKTLPERFPELVDNDGADIAYFFGCADKLMDLASGPAAISVLSKAGFSVSLPKQHCCGMPQQSYGFFGHEADFARKNIDSLSKYRYVVTTCATCLGELLHYRSLFADDEIYRERAEQLAEKCFDISEFLWKFSDLRFRDADSDRKVSFHQPCHLREVGRVAESHRMIESLPGVTLVKMEDADRCCGAAGTYNVFQYKNGMQIFGRKRAAFEKSGADLVTSSCPTCVLQFIDGLKAPRKVMHVVELVDDLTC